ncbi:MAG: hypothetical protein AAFV19_21445 [Pseudomonadota bacterium]
MPVPDWRNAGAETVRFAAPDRLTVTADTGGPAPGTVIVLFHMAGANRGEYREIGGRKHARGVRAQGRRAARRDGSGHLDRGGEFGKRLRPIWPRVCQIGDLAVRGSPGSIAMLRRSALLTCRWISPISAVSVAAA